MQINTYYQTAWFCINNSPGDFSLTKCHTEGFAQSEAFGIERLLHADLLRKQFAFISQLLSYF
jgi:hypothetical protein